MDGVLHSTGWAAMERASQISSQETLMSLIIFALFAICLLWPPTEFVSAGLTVENLIHFYLGDPYLDPIEYNCRKIVVNRAFIGCLPLLYFIFAFFFHENAVIFTVVPTTNIHYAAHASVYLLLASAMYVLYHHFTRFENLRAIQFLRLYSNNLESLKQQIAAEYRSFQNFSVSLSFSSRIIVSDSWLMHFNKYDFVVVNISDVFFEAIDAQEFALTVAGQEVQYVRIKANVINRPIPAFHFRINSTNFRDLQDKLAQRIQLTRDIILLVSPSERFVRAFAECVAENGEHEYPEVESLDPCIGCYSERANVKIVLGCEPDELGRRQCRECYCRPLWCVSCLGRVFAGKQDQAHPATWLSGRADCPTCRATFCVRDVKMLASG